MFLDEVEDFFTEPSVQCAIFYAVAQFSLASFDGDEQGTNPTRFLKSKKSHTN